MNLWCLSVGVILGGSIKSGRKDKYVKEVVLHSLSLMLTPCPKASVYKDHTMVGVNTGHQRLQYMYIYCFNSLTYIYNSLLIVV